MADERRDEIHYWIDGLYCSESGCLINKLTALARKYIVFMTRWFGVEELEKLEKKGASGRGHEATFSKPTIAENDIFLCVTISELIIANGINSDVVESC